MLPLLARGDPGTARSILIDGITFSILPASMEITPEPVSDYVDMLDGGAREFQRRPHFDGVPNHSDRYTFEIPYDSIHGDDLDNLELIRVTGGIHRITVWRLVPIVWACKTGVQRYYFPRFRKCAPWLYDGLQIGGGIFVDTSAFPTIAQLNGEDLEVNYAEGPTLADPGAGEIVIARQPDASGPTMDYTAVRIGTTVATGDELVMWLPPTFEVSMRAPRIRLSGLNEHHAHTFVEV